ncbi:MAG: protein kinase domain-containing protein [Anaerolineae bacterium]
MPEGTVLRDRYRLERLLGRGGMADVYLAFDLRRQVHIAVKLLREDLAEDPEFLQRFQREAEALARLDHPYIVRFYSFERQRPLAFIVMDYVPGTTLRTRLMEAGGPLPAAEVTQVVRQIGSALQYAHNEGFIHRDIKPGNIMLRTDGTALLSDFGIARAMAAMTMTMAPLGTPAYMSPEQILGQEADPRTDVYCLGVVMYEMVTGRRPFAGDSGTGTMSADRVRAEHLHAPPKDPRSLNPGLPTAAAQVILRALAKNPAQRWPNMTALVQAWEAAVSGAPAVTTPAQHRAGVTNGIPAIATHGPEPAPPPPVAGRRRSGSKLGWLLWAVAGVFTLLFAFVVVVLYRSLTSASASSNETTVAQQQTLDARTQQTAVALAVEWGTATASAGGQSPTATAAPTPTPAATATGEEKTDPVTTATAAAIGTEQASAGEKATAEALAAGEGAAKATTATAEAAAAAQATTDAAAANAQATTDAQIAADATAKAAAIINAPTATTEAVVSEPAGVAISFERETSWRRGDEPHGDFTRSSEQVYSGSYAGRLGYDFPAVTNNYVVFSPRPAVDIGKAGGIAAWVYGDGSGHFLNAWIRDSAGEIRQYSFGQITHQGWQQMTAPFNEAAGWPNAHIDGPDSGGLDYPVSLYAIVLDGVPDGQASKGVIYLDDISGY